MKKKKKIDVSKDECPMTFVKTKIFLENTSSKEDRIIVVKGFQNFVSIKNTLIEQNYKIKTKCIKKNYYEIVVMTES